MRKLGGVIVASLWLLGGPADATNIVSLQPVGFDPATPVPIGQNVEFSLEMAFTDTTLGGGVTITFDSAVFSLVSIVFDAGFTVDDKDFRCPTDPTAPNPVSCPANPAFVSWGNFAGLTGTHNVARVTLEAITLGEVEVTPEVTATFSSPMGQPLPVGTIGVPEPGATVLLLAFVAGAAVRRYASRAQ